MQYERLSPALAEQIREDRRRGVRSRYAAVEETALRRHPERDTPDLVRTPYVRDIDKILHCPFYNRYTDKTQVFAFYRNDDLTRRGLHVQLVSRIARTLAAALGLNLDLVEAIALGHDIGHTPFGHAGERFLDTLLYADTGRHFFHNVHSVRVLDAIFPYNITLDTLAGIAGHNGECEASLYRPHPLADFAAFDTLLSAAECDAAALSALHPSTLEGCCVRVADIIAYLGKDRQDAARAGIIGEEDFKQTAIGVHNAEIIGNMVTNIIECSYGKPYLTMDKAHFEALAVAKEENYQKIYLAPAVATRFSEVVAPLMEKLYRRLLADLREGKRTSPIFTHHVAYVERAHYTRELPYAATEPHRLVADYIASMTDGYFMDICAHLLGERGDWFLPHFPPCE